jgi:hypothetical protein
MLANPPVPGRRDAERESIKRPGGRQSTRLVIESGDVAGDANQVVDLAVAAISPSPTPRGRSAIRFLCLPPKRAFHALRPSALIGRRRIDEPDDQREPVVERGDLIAAEPADRLAAFAPGERENLVDDDVGGFAQAVAGRRLERQAVKRRRAPGRGERQTSRVPVALSASDWMTTAGRGLP